MKVASDFRQTARECLKGNWVTAVIAGLIATLLGGATSMSINFNVNVSSSGGEKIVIENPTEGLGAMLGGIAPVVLGVLGTVLVVVVLVVLVIAVAYFILSSFVQVGYAKFNLNVIDGKPLSLDTLFAYVSDWKRTALANLWQTIYILLWSCLFIVPGIVASYSYAMTKYILAEDSTVSPEEAIARSKELMAGNKWRLCCLHFSFLGWAILAGLTFGIGNLWLTPYRHAAEADFYRNITEAVSE
ncbi:MAG: DUF975 family protein [Clostridia bacterium]|nr:DUF975 family protein [Clostridia bacterium]